MSSIDRGHSVATRIARVVIRGYQRVTEHRPTPCRFVPTCSHYGLQALEEHGFVSGLTLTARRLVRCTPWSTRRGWDPVPSPADGADRGQLFDPPETRSA